MFGLREEIEFVPVCLRPGQTKSQKEIQRRVHTGCKEKRATRAKFVVFYLLIELVSFDVLVAVAVSVAASPAVAVRLCSQDLSTCVNGKESEQVFGKNACHLFTRSIYICHSRFGPLVNFFVYLETGIWVERKKMAVV